MSDSSFSLTAPAPALPTRRPLDKYRTPLWATQALIDRFPDIRGDLFIDPCAGDGRMAHQFRAAGRFDSYHLNDIDPHELGLDSYLDATTEDYWRQFVDVNSRTARVWVVSNTEFLRASEIAWLAINRFRNVALLLRATWLEPTEDRQWLCRFPPMAEIVLPRLSFTGAGRDSAGCRWLIWGDVPAGIHVVGKPTKQQELLG